MALCGGSFTAFHLMRVLFSVGGRRMGERVVRELFGAVCDAVKAQTTKNEHHA